MLIEIFLFKDRKGRMPLSECENDCGTGCGLLFVILVFLFHLNSSGGGFLCFFLFCQLCRDFQIVMPGTVKLFLVCKDVL